MTDEPDRVDLVAVMTSLPVTDVTAAAAAAAAAALGPRVLVLIEDGFAGRDAVTANASTATKNR